MTRSEAQNIIMAKAITSEQLGQIFELAKKEIKDWKKASTINKEFSRGAVWNILYGYFTTVFFEDPTHVFDLKNTQEYHFLTLCIREYGEYLPKDLMPNRVPKKKIKVYHEEPKF